MIPTEGITAITVRTITNFSRSVTKTSTTSINGGSFCGSCGSFGTYIHLPPNRISQKFAEVNKVRYDLLAGFIVTTLIGSFSSSPGPLTGSISVVWILVYEWFLKKKGDIFIYTTAVVPQKESKATPKAIPNNKRRSWFTN
jgi:hypothetical protein